MKKGRVKYLKEVLRKILWKTWEINDGKWKQSLIDIYINAVPISKEIGTSPLFIKMWIKRTLKEIDDKRIKIDFKVFDVE